MLRKHAKGRNWEPNNELENRRKSSFGLIEPSSPKVEPVAGFRSGGPARARASDAVAPSPLCYVTAKSRPSRRLGIWSCHKPIKDNSRFIIGEVGPAAENLGLSASGA